MITVIAVISGLFMIKIFNKGSTEQTPGDKSPLTAHKSQLGHTVRAPSSCKSIPTRRSATVRHRLVLVGEVMLT